MGRIGGEVAALDIPADEGGNWLKIAQLVLLIASLNLALFVFNLVPLLPSTAATSPAPCGRRSRRAGPSCAASRTRATSTSPRALPVAYGMSLVLHHMSVLLIYADIVNPINIFG